MYKKFLTGQNLLRKEKYKENTRIMKRMRAFMKKNMYYVFMGICVVAIGGMLTFAIMSSRDTGGGFFPPDDGSEVVRDKDNPYDQHVVVKPTNFIVPVENGTIIRVFNDSTPTMSSTLGIARVHLATAFAAELGSDVFAVYDGTIESITHDAYFGTVVTINHGNGLKTVYKRLAEGADVTVGEKVAQGDIIGQIGEAIFEHADGDHLHFKVFKDGIEISGEEYFADNTK
jgi:murein DD-endopeptidase MepM/ murein hydrolase activator NlpD